MQQQSAATAPHGNDQIRPAKAFELRQRPLSTALPLDGKEMVLAMQGGSIDNDEADMGTFGTGPFDNDGALDLLNKLADQRREVLERIFFRVRGHPDLLG